MDRADVERCVQGYERAWSSNDPEDIGSLFTEDATYRFHPYDEPLRGRDAIVAQWIENKDEPEDYAFRFEVAGIDGDVAFVQGVTEYFIETRPVYSNLHGMVRAAPRSEGLRFADRRPRARRTTEERTLTFESFPIAGAFDTGL